MAERIKYIDKESNNLDDNLIGLEDVDYLEYSKDYEIVKSKEFKQWLLALKPKDVRDKEISQQALYKIKSNIQSGKPLNLKVKLIKILIKLYKINKRP